MLIQEQLARVISLVFHPVILPLLAAIALLNTETYVSYSLTTEVKNVIYAILGICTCILPVVSALLLLKGRIISSLHMESREERKLPFLITAVYYFTAYYLLTELPLPRIIYLLQLGATLAVILLLIINLRWKISAHMTGIGGFTGAILGISMQLEANLLLLLISAILASGLIGTARLLLKTHQPAQVYAGFVLGLCCELLTLMLL